MLADVERVLSIPVATAQCRTYLRTSCRGAARRAANSTAEAARMVRPSAPIGRTAAIGPELAAEVYGLEVLAADIEDHPENQTRFALVGREGVPRRPGTTRRRSSCSRRPTSPAACSPSSRSSRPGPINLTNLHSRPTKKALGDYCFIIDLEGHIADELVADCLRDLKSKQADVKFLGSYPRPARTASRCAATPKPRGALPTSGSPAYERRSPGADAEREGFEPPGPCEPAAFKAAAFVHSATAPSPRLRPAASAGVKHYDRRSDRERCPSQVEGASLLMK